MGFKPNVLLLDDMDVRLDMDDWEDRAEATEDDEGEVDLGVEISEVEEVL
jgi:hypothetical protein